MLTTRNQTKQISVGSVKVGGGAPITVQSMTNTDTRDVSKTLEQIMRLYEQGCEIVRLAVPDEQAAQALEKIKKKSPVPLVADIHFQWELAVMALNAGIDKLRINPGNIGSKEKVARIVAQAKDQGVPIRIGVNAGSLDKDLLEKYGRPTPEALVESAMGHVQILEELDFQQILLSVKAFSIHEVDKAYTLLAQKTPYPLHVGITEAGTPWAGTIRSSMGLALVLNKGIGDTIRVSLTGDPVEEVRVGYQILKTLELRNIGITMLSCPTCGRCEIDLVQWATEVEQRLSHIKQPIKVAVMGCVVNGPGEAKEAHIGVAGGKNAAILFINGKLARKLRPEEVVQALVTEVEAMTADN